MCGIYEGQKGEAADTNWNLITNKFKHGEFFISCKYRKKIILLVDRSFNEL